MESRAIQEAFRSLTTALIADAGLRAEEPLRFAPPGCRPVLPRDKAAGRVLPARHHGSVDVFLEAMQGAKPGDLLVIDNGGRVDEGCIGDLITIEARVRGLAGVLVWGLHRDTDELAAIGVPVFSYGAYPAGPRRLDSRPRDALERAAFGGCEVARSDVAFADSDGIVFAPATAVEKLIEIARELARQERSQSRRVTDGDTLSAQFRLDEYVTMRAADPTYTFSRHLRRIGGEIGE